jgi:uncharacterized protein YbbC (DUF1343 family)
LPFDVITGTSRLREQIDAGVSVAQIEESWSQSITDFRERRKNYLLYE